MAQKTLRQTIAEMIGKITPARNQIKIDTTYNLYGQTPSVDYSKTDYDLTRAIYYASIVKGRDGSSKGQQFLLGAVFGKPIINSSASFAFAQTPTFTLVDENDEELAADDPSTKALQDWFDKNKSKVFDTCKNSLRDGDAYIQVDDEGKARLIPPEQVDVVCDNMSGDIIGYDVTNYIEEDDGAGGTKTIKYVEKYRTTDPIYQKVRIENDTETVIEETISEGEEIPMLDIVGFHNERDPKERYGNSEFQNLYYLMANYHAVFESGIKNVMYNSTALPVISGVDDVEKWLQTNGEKALDGSFKVKWDKDKLFIGGKDFNVQIVQAAQNAGDTLTMLNILFWSLCQASETPEFVMGAAVASSKASVSEQMPVAVRKADRKRTQFTGFYEQLAKVVLNKLSMIDTSLNSDYEVRISFPDIIDDDQQLNLETIKVLSEQGVITDKTKLLLAGISDKIDDPETEVNDAHAEMAAKAAAVSQFGTTSPQANQTEETTDETETPEETTNEEG